MALEGEQTSAGGTLPPSIVVSNLKADLVIVNKNEKTVSIFELTVPGEQRIEAANKLKYEKLEFQGATRPNSSSSGGGLVASLPNRALRPCVEGFAPILTLPMNT